MEYIIVSLKRGLAGKPQRHRRIARALGLRRMGQKRKHKKTDNIIGMVKAISYMLNVEEGNE